METNYYTFLMSTAKYAKEKEEEKKNTTTLAICHGTLLATTGDYFRNDILYKTNY